MRKTVLITILAFVSVMTFWMTVPSGCAVIVPPSGGPRDSLPPVLLKVEPGDSTVNFNSKTITFTFNEYIDLRDVPANVTFTPSLPASPPIAASGKSIIVKFKENELEPNTTYSLNFGNALVDLNEGNQLRGFSYTFSTGPTLDSLEISGRVILAETGAIDTNIIAVLYRDLNDSAIAVKRPQYISKMDRSGNFHFRNLPKDTFAVYVFGVPTQREYRRGELFAFADKPVMAGEADSLVLYAYRPETKTTTGSTPQNQRIPASDRRLRFTPSPGQQDLKTDYTLSFQTPLRIVDSTKLQLSTDSSYSPAPFTVSLDTTGKILSIKSPWKENTRYNLVLQKDFATDTNGRQLLKTDTLFFATRKMSDYGSIRLRFRNLDLSRKPLLQFIQGNNVQLSVPLTSNILDQAFMQPGDYNLRIVYDTNGNGKWDPGDFFGTRSQPELVYPIQRTVTVKPAFVNEAEILIE